MITSRDATTADYHALLAGLGITQPTRTHRAIPVQIALGRAWCFLLGASSAHVAPAPVNNAPPLALAGIVHDATHSEAWFIPGPAADVHMLGLARQFRARLEAERRLIGRPITACVSPHNPAGLRLARVCGLNRRIEHAGRLLWSQE